MRTQPRARVFCCMCCLLFLVAACAPRAETPTVLPLTSTVSTPSATPTASETPTLIPSLTHNATVTVTPTAAVSLTPTLLPGVSPTPGLVLHGRVHLADGSGVGGVAICRSYASYPGVVVATTGADGAFQSDFAFIPGDEMVGVWPTAAGYTFDPPFMRWRHYYGLEDQALDFVASASAATAVPPAPCK